MIYDRRRHSLICVCEDHRNQQAEPENKLIRLNLMDKKSDTGRQPLNVLVAGSDFYASPSLSPDGSQLAWLSWDHPNMPWDGTELWVGQIGQDGALENAEQVAGGTDESIFQPRWSPDGTLYFVSDRTGWWNIYRWENNQIAPLVTMEAEFGMPQWLFGMSTYAFESDQRLICSFTQKGKWRLAQETHKFESRYLDQLIGAYPERKNLYDARSPIRHAEGLDCPIIFFQGLEDKVVPPGQADKMVAILKEKQLPVAYIPFEKEQHGFCMAQNIKRALDAELYFYSRIFGFEPADEIEPVEIDNL
jgi:dipeptidyl aminopeptidase/acylaminoacyl peptidase